MNLRAYYLFLKGSEDWFLAHAHTGKEAKRLFGGRLRDYDDGFWFPDVRVLRAKRYDKRSETFAFPLFDDDARPDCDRCGKWECPGGNECKGEEW